MKQYLYPVSIAQAIPIFGVNREDLPRGAFASYASSRYAVGYQAAHHVSRVLAGIAPADLPIETPNQLEFVINRSVVQQLGLELSLDTWNFASDVVQIEITP